jgi:hypothetical protein
LVVKKEVRKKMETNGARFLFLLQQQIPPLDSLDQNWCVVDVAIVIFVVLPVFAWHFFPQTPYGSDLQRLQRKV